MASLYDQMTFRNIGIFTPEEQAKLKNSCVAIAGVGGVGGLLAERLIRIGIEKLNITDPGTFEPTNSNRQYASSTKTVDVNKAEAVYNELHDINPFAVIDYNAKGIVTQDDAYHLVDNADIVVDEMDFPMLKESIYLQRAARKKGIYYIFSAALGFGASTTVFSPDGITLEEYNGFSRDCDVNDLTSYRIPLKNVSPKLPSYIEKSMSLEDVELMIQGKKAISTNSIGVGLSSIVTANEVVNVLLRKKEMVTAPDCIIVDLLDRHYTVERRALNGLII
jgi:molybdopterin/thiamine biosynthesis adenylyltransferase